MNQPNPTANVSVRPAVPDDVPLLFSLIRELGEYERLADQVVATEEDLGEHLFGQSPAIEALIGILDAEPVGFAIFFGSYSTFAGRRGLYLEDLFVRPAARGHGVGKALLIQLARIARDRDCARFEWAVLDWNKPAIEFYRALGASPLDDWTTFRLTGDSLSRLADSL